MAARAGAVLVVALTAATDVGAQVPGTGLVEEELLRRTEARLAGDHAPPRAPTEAELLRRIDSLRPVLEAARTAEGEALARRRLEAAERPRPATRVVRAGPLRVVTLPEQADLAVELFEEVWRNDLLGVSGSPALAGSLFVFQWAWSRPEPLYVDPVSAGEALVHRVELTRFWVGTREGVRERVRDAVWAALRSDIAESAPLRRWIGSTGYPVASRAARLFAVTASETHRMCVEGRTSACLAGLGLSSASAEPAAVPVDLPGVLLLEAMRRGGDEAWSRILRSPGAEPLELLVSASGLEEDQLVQAWSEAFELHRPGAGSGLGATALTVLLWALGFGALALRSSRWRLA